MSAPTPALLATRDALRQIVREHQTVATGLGEWCCKCSPGKWRPTAHRSEHVTDALMAAIQTPAEWAAGLADDEALVERASRLYVAAVRPRRSWRLGDKLDWPSRFRALADALAEQEAQR